MNSSKTKPRSSFKNFFFKSLFLLAVIFSIIHFNLAYKSGRVYDFTGFVINTESSGFIEALNSFNYNQVQPLLQIFNWLLYNLAGRNALSYHLIFLFLLVIGISVWWIFISDLLKNSIREIVTRNYIQAFAILFFLSSPYLVEPIIYKVCQAYLLSFIFLGAYLFALLKYLLHERNKFIWIGLFILIAQLYTFDYIVIYPFITLLFILVFCRNLFTKRNVLFVILSFLALTFYFFQNKMLLGQWTGHYGDNIHLDFPLISMLKTMGNYHLKQLFYIHFLSFPLRSWFYESGLAFILIMLVFAGGVFSLLGSGKDRKPKHSQLIGFALLGGILVLIPVSNLYFPYLMEIENDRYGMLFQMFLSIFLATAIFQTRLHLNGKLFIAICILGFQWFNQNKHLKTWRANEKIVSTVLENIPNEFRNTELDIFLLNLPDNLKGTYLFRSLNSNSDLLSDTYYATTGERLGANFITVAQMNMNELSDGANAKWTSELTLNVEMNQFGTWWWQDGVGAISRNTENYDFNLAGMQYTVKFYNDFDFTKSKFFIWSNGKFEEIVYPY